MGSGFKKSLTVAASLAAMVGCVDGKQNDSNTAHPDSAYHYLNRGIEHMESKEFAEARQNLERSLTFNPEHKPSHLNLATSAFAEGDYSTAIKSYEDFFVLVRGDETLAREIPTPDFSAARRNLMISYHMIGDLGQAVELGQESHSLYPDDEMIFNVYKSVFNERKTKLESEINRNPINIDSLLELGSMYSVAGGMSRAEDIANRVLEIDSETADAYLLKARIELIQSEQRRLQGDITTARHHNSNAIDYAENALELGLTSPELYYTLASGYLNINQTNEALKHLRTGVELFSDDVKLNYKLGTVLETIGDRTGQVYLRNARLLQPENPIFRR